MTELTAERLRELLDYAPDTGVFTWRVQRQWVKAGSVAGHRRESGYVYICVEGKPRPAHRLAWLHVRGSWPLGVIDHRDRVHDNNRFSNLRDASHRENMQNQVEARKGNSVGLAGVTRHGKGFQAYARLNGERKALGTFKTPELAHAAYLAAKAPLLPQVQGQ